MVDLAGAALESGEGEFEKDAGADPAAGEDGRPANRSSIPDAPLLGFDVAPDGGAPPERGTLGAGGPVDVGTVLAEAGTLNVKVWPHWHRADACSASGH